jgi:hypothetical protein
MFASRTFLEHLARGLFGFSAIVIAIRIGKGPDAGAVAASLTLGVAAIVAFRGCPICWTTGLVEMIWSRARGGPR